MIGVAVGRIGDEIKKFFRKYFVFNDENKIEKELTEIILASLGNKSDSTKLVKRSRLRFVGGG